MAALATSPLGRTGLQVTRLGYGSLNLGGKGTRSARYVDPATAERVLNVALDSGINLIDTAPDYGEAEEVIGRYLSNRRDEYFLASKCGCPVGALSALPPPPNGPRPHNYTPDNIRAGVDQSLGRMGTDHLDLVQIHESPTAAAMEANDSIATLLQLRQEGKVRFIGISSTLPNVVEHLSMDVFDSFQLPYSALQPEYETIIDQAAAKGVGVIIRGGMAQGSIATTPEAAPPHRQDQVRAQNDLWARSAVDEVLEGMSPMEFMLRYTLTHPGVTSVIVGTANPAHLADNLAAASRGPLPGSVYDQARRRLAEAGDQPGTASHRN
jgi:aryl-alcohol dehydrogenase-like predicted oxidoreductase